LREPVAAFLDPLDSLNIFFQRNLLGVMIEALFGQPAPVHPAPVRAPFEDATVAQEKRQKVLTRPPQIRDCRPPTPG